MNTLHLSRDVCASPATFDTLGISGTRRWLAFAFQDWITLDKQREALELECAAKDERIAELECQVESLKTQLDKERAPRQGLSSRVTTKLLGREDGTDGK